MDFAQKTFLICGALFGFISVLAGAFGSHYLKQKLTPEDLHIFEIGVRYQMYHALCLIGLSAILKFYPSSLLTISGWLFIIGTVIFSGSLYLLVFSGIKKWGAVTPVGGFLLLFGWLLSAIAGFFI